MQVDLTCKATLYRGDGVAQVVENGTFPIGTTKY